MNIATALDYRCIIGSLNEEEGSCCTILGGIYGVAFTHETVIAVCSVNQDIRAFLKSESLQLDA